MRPSFAAVVYTPRSNGVGFLAAFAEERKKHGVRVAGLVQEKVLNDDGTYAGIDAVDVVTGARIPIKRVPKHDYDKNACALDASVLVGTSGVLRDAIKSKAELIVFDKFGVEEQKGRGLSDEIMLAISDGIPFLISVPETALEIWKERTGGMGGVLPVEVEALERWWGGVSG